MIIRQIILFNPLVFTVNGSGLGPNRPHISKLSQVPVVYYGERKISLDKSGIARLTGLEQRIEVRDHFLGKIKVTAFSRFSSGDIKINTKMLSYLESFASAENIKELELQIKAGDLTSPLLQETLRVGIEYFWTESEDGIERLFGSKHKMKRINYNKTDAQVEELLKETYN